MKEALLKPLSFLHFNQCRSSNEITTKAVEVRRDDPRKTKKDGNVPWWQLCWQCEHLQTPTSTLSPSFALFYTDLRKRKQPIVLQQSDLRETEKTLLSRTDLQINRNRNEKNTSELVCVSKWNFEWEKEPYCTRMSRRSKCNELGCRNHHRNRLLEPKSRAREMATDIGWWKKLVHRKEKFS